MSKPNGSSKKFVKFSPNSRNPEICPELFKDEMRKKLKKLFQNKSVSFKNDSVECSTSPFHHCVIENFLCYKNEELKPAKDFVNELRNDLLKLQFHTKSNDLYKFIQTDELMMTNTNEDKFESQSHHLRHFCSLLRISMLPWLRDVTGIDLNDDIDMFCAQYKQTDCLLCHDDELEHRCIAYIYYLTPDWLTEDGGLLELFNSKIIDDKLSTFEPDKVIKSISPAMNSFVFFEVSPKSFHQVSEVLSKFKTRVSLTGWYHGPTIARFAPDIDPKPPLLRFTPSDGESSYLSDWIKPSYLSIAMQGEIQEQFIDQSEIQLNQFLLEEKFQEVNEALICLTSYSNLWKLCGPPSRCSYHKLDIFDNNQSNNGDCSSTIDLFDANNKALCCNNAQLINHLNKIKKLVDVFTSEEMFLFISNITGLSFHPMSINSDSESDDDVIAGDVIARKRLKQTKPEQQAGWNSGCRFQFRRWQHGSYTLIRDTDSERGEYALDVNLFFTDKDWSDEHGGYTSYVAADEAEELLTTIPTGNCLSLTYRDRDALRFVKHLNQTAPGIFYDLSLVYYE